MRKVVLTPDNARKIIDHEVRNIEVKSIIIPSIGEVVLLELNQRKIACGTVIKTKNKSYTVRVTDVFDF